MYAIIDYAGKQFKVEQGQELKVPLTEGESGGNLQLDRVLLLGNGDTTLIGQPTVAGASVDATILSHGRDRKITVFHFRRRKGYQKTAGHRQDYTVLRINSINVAQDQPTAPAKTEAKAAETVKAPAAKKKTAPKKAAAAPKPATKKKPAAKKTTGAARGKSPAKPAPKKKSGNG